jgi:DNA-binding MarR family transcriptional regulator
VQLAEDRPTTTADAALIRAGVTRLARRLRAERPPTALSSNKITVLSHLYRHGPSTPSDIATAEHQHPQSLTRVFADLHSTGLVSRSPSERDGRQAVLAITDAGRDVLTADMAHRDAWLQRALHTLTDTEVGVLRIAAEVLDRLSDARLPDSARPPG